MSQTLTFNVSECFRTAIFIFVSSDRSSGSRNVCLSQNCLEKFFSSGRLQTEGCKQSSTSLQAVFKGSLSFLLIVLLHLESKILCLVLFTHQTPVSYPGTCGQRTHTFILLLTQNMSLKTDTHPTFIDQF